MKKLIALAVVICLGTVYGSTGPFRPHVDKRFKNIDSKDQIDGKRYERVVRVSVDASVLTLNASGSDNLSQSIPANSIVNRVYCQNETVLVAADSNTISLTCESSGDLLVALDASGNSLNAITYGLGSGDNVSSTFMDTGCSPIIVDTGSGSSGITAGKLVCFVEYVVGE